jgi:hypothetical protein
MQSTPRSFDGNGWFTVASRSHDANEGVALGNGNVDAATHFAPIPVAQLNPSGVTAANDQLNGTGNGSLRFGGDADWQANLGSGGSGGAGNDGASGTDGNQSKAECRPRSRSGEQPREGFVGQVISVFESVAGQAYDVARAFVDGMIDQAGDLWDTITNPGEVIRGLLKLGEALVNDFEGTIRALAGQTWDEFSRIMHCGVADVAYFAGNNISPAAIIRVGTRLARLADELGDVGTSRVIREIEQERRDIDCRSSFIAGTPVWTPTGFTPIEQLGTRDKVWSRNDRTFEDRPQTILRTISREASAYHELRTEAGILHVTEEHPLWVQGQGWVPVKDLRYGMPIATASGDTLVISNKRIEQPVKVYNFTVNNTENYFVGEQKVWAHNCFVRAPWYPPRSPSGFAEGQSDGGPGAWRSINRPTTPQYDYQQRVTGSTRGGPDQDPRRMMEYQIGNVDFDGYDSARRVLLDAKRFTSNCPMTSGRCTFTMDDPDGIIDPQTGAVRQITLGERIENRLIQEARRQLQAVADSPDHSIEWVISDEAAALHMREIFKREFGDGFGDRIRIVLVPPEYIRD